MNLGQHLQILPYTRSGKQPLRISGIGILQARCSSSLDLTSEGCCIIPPWWLWWVKEAKSIYVAPFYIKVHTKGSGMDHTVLPADNTMPAFPSWAFTRWHQHNNRGSRHPLAAYNSFIDPNSTWGTQSTNPDQWPGLILSPVTIGLLTEEALLCICRLSDASATWINIWVCLLISLLMLMVLLL